MKRAFSGVNRLLDFHCLSTVDLVQMHTTNSSLHVEESEQAGEGSICEFVSRVLQARKHSDEAALKWVLERGVSSHGTLPSLFCSRESGAWVSETRGGSLRFVTEADMHTIRSVSSDQSTLPNSFNA